MMPIWTVDIFMIRPARESHFLQNCRGLARESLTLFRDLEKRQLFWSPAKWESRESLDEWRHGDTYRSVLHALDADILERAIHLMESVPGFSSDNRR